MTINLEEKYHGAAILRLFETINLKIPSLKFSLGNGKSRNCYLIEGIKPALIGKGQIITCGVYIKTSNARRSPWRFNFHKTQQDEISDLKQKYGEVFTIFSNGDDGFACLSFDELKDILDDVHEEQEWVAIKRAYNQGYRVSGNNGERENVLRKMLSLTQ